MEYEPQPGDNWSIEVTPGWRSLDFVPTWVAVLMIRRKDTSRYKRMGVGVVSDVGPGEAVSDLVRHYNLAR